LGPASARSGSSLLADDLAAQISVTPVIRALGHLFVAERQSVQLYTGQSKRFDPPSADGLPPVRFVVVAVTDEDPT
jgi:hypothetical protein